MLNLNNINNQKNFILIIFTLVIAAIALLFIAIDKNEKNEIKIIQNSLLDRSINHYNTVKEIQLWHTDNEGLYILNPKIRPNRHLLNNQLKFNDQNLIRISHDRLTKQFSRYATGFNSFYYKLTSLQPLNKKNLPDKFEKKGLEYLQNNPDKYFHDNIESAVEKGTLDLIGALKVEQKCLKCHGVEGYNIGEIKGGIRITIDTSKEKKQVTSIKEKFLNTKFMVILFGIIALGIIYTLINYVFKQKKELEDLNNNLEELVNERTRELNNLNIHLEDRIKEAVEKNKEQEKVMIAQSRHAAMGEMISMIAHQWRQPIAVISMAADNIKVDAQLDMIDNNEISQVSDDIIEQTKYLSKTIDDFSDFFKPNKEKEIIYPLEVINDSIKMLSQTLENNNIKLDTCIKDTKEISIYPRELLQVLINIIKNAKEAFENKDIEEKIITVELEEQKEDILIKICDNAGGIPEDVIGSIFDPYFSTKKEKNGTGLGLYMSETIIEKHLEGNLSAKNIKNGACFIITLPKKIKEENGINNLTADNNE